MIRVNRTSFTSTVVGAALTCILCLAAGSSRAQQAPDPFKDYEGWSGEAPPPLPPEKPAAASSASSTSQRTPDGNVRLSLSAGLWSLGARGIFAYTTSKNELLAGGDETNSTMFLRLTPTLTTFVQDRFQVGGSIGLLRKSLARESGGKATENDWLIEATGSYFLPLSQRFALVPGLGLGGYFGSSERTFTVGGKDITESTGTRGFAASAYFGAAYQMSESWQIRSGLGITALLGSETISSQSTSLSSSALHFGVPVELFYTFH